VGNKRKRVTFQEAYDCLAHSGTGRAVSSRDTEYTLEASLVKDVPAIIARPRSGRVVIHEDCWGDNITCQGTRAGGIYNGPYSIYDWCVEHSKE
jgi:hypothetical protein